VVFYLISFSIRRKPRPLSIPTQWAKLLTEVVNYPVLSSLSGLVESGVVGKHTLAAAKIAHEFGHVNQMIDSDGAHYKHQLQLVQVYITTLLSNGHNARDPRLNELTREIGGTPLELREDREYLAEANAMLYLRDRLSDSARLDRRFFRKG